MRQNHGFERQYPLTAVFVVNHYEFEGVDPIVLGNLPAKALIVGAFVEAEEAFNTSALTIDGAGLFTVAPVAAGATGRTQGAAFSQATARTPVTLTRDTDTDVTGRVNVVVSYVMPGRHNEVQE